MRTCLLVFEPLLDVVNWAVVRASVLAVDASYQTIHRLTEIPAEQACTRHRPGYATGAQ